MIDGYDAKSCNALQRPFYRPVEAAIRWCGLIAHEEEILLSIGEDGMPKAGQFPQWRCLYANTEKILDAIEHGSIPHGRDGRAVAAGELWHHVKRSRRTVRHADLREWMAKHYPDQKPDFLFDEIERSAHAAINADSFRALQADRDALKARVEKAAEEYRKLRSERDALVAECDLLRARADKMAMPGERAEATFLNIIGALLELLLGKTPAGKPHSVFESRAAIIDALLTTHADKPGISKSTLEAKFADARRRLNST